MLSPYTGQLAEKVYNLLPNPHKANTYYKITEGRYIYQNTKGYIHMLEILKDELGYTFDEYILKNNNKLENITEHYQHFNTKQEAIDNIEKGDNYNGNCSFKN